jgi:hypothetical protein
MTASRQRQIDGTAHTPWPPGLGRRLGLVVAVAGVVLSLAGCGIAASTAVPIPATAASPAQVLSAAVSVTAAQVDAALRAVGLSSVVSPVPYRPAESPALAAAPRLVLKALLPEDDAGAFIVVYDYKDAQTAFDAGREMAAYLASGPGRIQFPNDARAVIRQVGSTLVFFSWSPATANDPKTGDIATALETVGFTIPVVR